MKTTTLYEKGARVLAQIAPAVLSLGLLVNHSHAATILITNQVSTVEQTQVASAFFTNSADNAISLTAVATTGPAGQTGSIGGTIGAGDGAATVSSGTFTVVGNATSTGGWTDGNGIPTGITLTFNVQFTVSTTDGFLTTQANSGTQLGNGIGITPTVGAVGDLGAGKNLEISTIAITGVNFSGSVTEPGVTFTPGSVSNPRWNRLRSNNLAEGTEGVLITVGSDSWGCGTETRGTMANGLFIDNVATYPEVHPTFVTAGPMIFETSAGVWNLKGLGFQYEITYEIVGEAIVPTWTGNGGNNNWSTGANWNTGAAPQNGQMLRFGAALQQANVNDVADLFVTLIDFTTGGFNLSGLPLTNTVGISNQAGINTVGLNLIYSGNTVRSWDIASGSELSFSGTVHSYDNGNFDVSGGGTLSVGNGGSISLDTNTINGNLRLGAVAGNSITLNVNSGGTITIPNNLTGGNANRLRVGFVAGSSATVNINNGGVIISPDDPANPARSLVEVGLGDGTVSVLNLNAGGKLHAQRVEASASGNPDSTFNFNGGLLEAHRINGSTTFFNNMDRAQVQSGGAIVDTTNSIAFVLPLTEDPGSTGGGLTKLGVGTLVLPAGTSYTGPTVVSNGTLSLTLPMSSSALTLRPGTILNVGVNDSSWNASSSATFDGNSTLNLNFGGPLAGAPLIVGTLTANGTTTLNVSGTVTSVGSYPLIDYTTRAGSGGFQLGTRPAGTVATLVTNVGNSSIDLLVSDLASDLFWTGNVNGDWDIATTPNWDFLSGGSGSTTYNENASVGDHVTFFNNTANPAITLKADVKPVQMNFFNSSTDYSIGGTGFGIYGTGRMVMEGGGIVTLTTSNSFSGGISNSLGFVEIGNNAALGTGLVILRPSFTSFLSTGLRSDGATARTVSNAVQFRSFAENELNFKIGDATKNGKLTFSGPIDLANRRNEISMESDVEFAGTITNGTFSKGGPGTLVVTGAASLTADDVILAEGDVVVDGGSWNHNTFGLRLVAQDGLISRLILTNNGIITLEGGSNLRVAGAVEGSFFQGNGVNEFIMYSGQLNLVGTTAEASVGGGPSLASLGRISLLGGTATVRGLRGLANAGPSELVLNGITVNGSTTGSARLANFISGFTNATIQSAGVTLNIPADSVAVAAQNLEGTGGVIKGGDGVLYLDGNNTYAGSTVANAGGLGGTGVINGPVNIGAAATLVPGTSPSAGAFSSIGTLTINNSLALAGTAFMEVDKATLAADMVNAASINYGGTLVVSNASTSPLVGGEVFQLFNVTGAKAGNFGNVMILPDAGFTGTFDPGTGQLTIVAVTSTAFNPPTISGTDIILTGTGVANGTYSLLSSTNVAAPISEWVTNTTGSFNGSGVFSNAIPLGTESQQFFLLQTP